MKRRRPKYGEKTKIKILEAAKECRYMKEIADKIGLRNVNMYPLLERFGIFKKVDKIMKENRIKYPKLLDMYSKELILNIARTSVTLDHMGRRLELSRERIRQILELYNIASEVYLIFKINKMRALELLQVAAPIRIGDNTNEQLVKDDSVLK